MRLKRAPYVPIRNDSHVISNNERDLVRLALQMRHRMDGRSLSQLRPARIQLTRSSMDGETGCTVQWGSSISVHCHCQGQIVPPMSDRPNEGFVQIAIDLSPMASTGFRLGPVVTNGSTGKAGGGGGSLDDSQKLQANRILRCIENLVGNCLDSEALVIVPGSWVWQLQLRITSWDCGNNPSGGSSSSNNNALQDASVLATMAALRHYRQPSTSLDQGSQPRTISLDQKEGTPLPLHHTSLSISFTWLEKEEDASRQTNTLVDWKQSEEIDDSLILLVDPTWQEQLVAQGNELSLNLNVHGEVCGMASGGAVTPALLRACHKRAMTLVPQLAQSLESSLQEANQQAIREGMERIQQQQKQQQQQEETVPIPKEDAMEEDATTAVLEAAEESYRKQALEYNLGHQAVQVRENKDDTSRAATNSSSHLLQTLLQAASKQSQEQRQKQQEAERQRQQQQKQMLQDAPQQQQTQQRPKAEPDATGVEVVKPKAASSSASSEIQFEETAPVEAWRQQEEERKRQEAAAEAARMAAAAAHAETSGVVDSDDEEAETMQLKSEFDNDDDAVKTYNREYKEMEEEEEFWESNRNTNHRTAAATTTTAEEEGKKEELDNVQEEDEDEEEESPQRQQHRAFRGPDKVKGGKLPKPAPAPTKSGEKPTPANARRKTRKMDNRRNQQKKAMHKRANG